MTKLHFKTQFFTHFTITILLCFGHCFITSASATQFELDNLTLNSLKLLGDAHLINNRVQLTRDLPVPTSAAGRVLYSKPIVFRKPGTDVPSSFSCFFTFSVTNVNPASIGAGLAFVIVPDDESVGDGGRFIGILDEKGVVSKSIGVEFDTMMDVEFKDINGNHVGLDLNSMVSANVGDLSVVGIDLKSGDLISCWIEYSGLSRVMNVSVSYSSLKPNVPLLSVDVDLVEYVNDFMFVGFSGSTQGSTEVHNIEWWSFYSWFESESGTGSAELALPPAAGLLNPAADSVGSKGPALAPVDSVSKSRESGCHDELCNGNPGAVAGVVTAGAFFLAIFAGVLIWLYSNKLKNVNKSQSLGSDIIMMPKEFSFKELKLATRCFDANRIIGHGAFGTVYKGILPETGDVVAIKRSSHTSQGKNEFLSELSIIGSLRHRNLVRLQGYCHEKGEILLVYDLMLNGSLDKALFESRMSLPWPHRCKILLGVASALAYLHQECENQVIHRDVKSSNIMLDEGFNARLGDFGLARQIEHDKSPDATVAAGTMGYLAPEYLLTGRATDKTDVFSYGAVVLEVATGRRPIEKDANVVAKAGVSSNLVEWVWSLHREGRLLKAADPRLGGEFNEVEMTRILTVGLACSNPDPQARPTMRGVVQILVGEAEVPNVPRAKPSMSFSTSHLVMCLQDSSSDCNDLIKTSTSSSDGNLTGDEIV